MKKFLLLLAVASLSVFGCKNEKDSAPIPKTASTVTESRTVEASPTPIVTATPLRTSTPIPITKVNPAGLCRTDIEAGVGILVYGTDQNIKISAPALLERLAKLCVNAFNITFPYYQYGLTSSKVQTGEQTPSNESLCVLITEGKKRGFLVTLRPSMDEASLLEGWRGSIKPNDTSAWFSSYQDLMLSYAALAKECGADTLSVGFEMNSMEHHTTEWTTLIESIRSRYDVKITYAGNWVIREQVKFWDQLDTIGVDQFAPVKASVDATVEQLVKAWLSQEYFQAIRSAREYMGKPIVLAEIGITSQVGAHLQPAVWDQESSISLETQSRYIAAACEVYSDAVDGIYWWHFSLYAPPDPSTDKTFNILGKPAEKEVLKCYSKK